MAKKKKNNKSFLKYTVVVVVVLLPFVIFALLRIIPVGPETAPQINTAKSVEWSDDKYFGVEDRSKFPPISNPEYVSSSEANKFLTDDENVYTFFLGGKRYVYPEKILAFHHIVNDTVNDAPIAVALCLLTDSAAVYERKIDGSTLTFGTLAILYNGNLVMFDDKTDSYWLQLTGDSIKGKLQGNRLKSVARVDYTSWGKIKNMSQLKVLPPVKEMSFYQNFYKLSMKSNLGLFAIGKRKVPGIFPEYTTGIGIEVRDETKFYDLSRLLKKEIFEDEVGEWGLLFINDESTGSVKVFRRFVDNKVLTFTRVGSYLQDHQTMTKWDLDGVAIEGKLKGKKLISPFYTKVYWFGWWALFPETKY